MAPPQHLYLKFLATFFIGLVVGIVFNSTRNVTHNVSTVFEHLPSDSPDFTGWNRPFLKSGLNYLLYGCGLILA